MFSFRWNLAATFVESERREFIFEEIGLQIQHLDASQVGLNRHTSIDLEVADLEIVQPEKAKFEEFMKAHPELALRISLSTKGNESIHEASIAIGIEPKEPRDGKGTFDQQPAQAVVMEVLANLKLKTGHTRFRKIDYANSPFPEYFQRIADTQAEEKMYASRGMILLVVDASLKKFKTT